MTRRTVIFLFIFAMLLPLLLMREYTPSNELRYLNIVDDAIESGNFFTFYDHGEPYADKPPLYFWVMMLLKKIAGSHSLFLLCTILGLAPAFVIGWVMDRWTENKLNASESTAALMMLFSGVLFISSALVMRMDMLMCMFIILALYTFGKMYANKSGARDAKMKVLSHEARRFKTDRILLPIYVFLAIFSKGAVGFLAPVLCIIVFLISDRDLRIGKYLGWRFWLILIVLCSLWWTCVYMEGGKEYLNNLVFHQTIDRGVNSFRHKEPFWFYLAGYWWMAAVWSVLIVILLIKGWRKRLLGGIRIHLMVVSALTILVMLSAVSSKLAIYFLPAIPLFVYAAALMLPYFKDDRLIKVIVAAVAWIFIILGIATIFKKFIVPDSFSAELPKLWAPYWVIFLPLTLGGLLALKFLKDKSTCISISVISASILVVTFLGGLSTPSINKTIGVKDGCLEAARIAEKENLPLYYCCFRAGNNMDYYFRQSGRQIEKIDTVGLAGFKEGIVFFKEKWIKKDVSRRKELEARESPYLKNILGDGEYVKLGNDICYAVIPAKADTEQ